jgi:hypothetical protein
MNPVRKGRALTLILTHSGSSEVLKGTIDKARVGDREKIEAIRRLRRFTNISQSAQRIASNP